MNFYSDDNPDPRQEVAALLNCNARNIELLKFAVSNPDDGNPSIMTVEIYPVPMLDALFFIYSGDQALHDVIAFRNKRFVRVNRNERAIQHIDRLNDYLLERVTNVMPGASKEIYTEDDEQDKLMQKDLQIQQLRDRNRVDKNTIQSLRTQLRISKGRKK